MHGPYEFAGQGDLFLRWDVLVIVVAVAMTTSFLVRGIVISDILSWDARLSVPSFHPVGFHQQQPDFFQYAVDEEISAFVEESSVDSVFLQQPDLLGPLQEEFFLDVEFCEENFAVAGEGADGAQDLEGFDAC